MKILITENQLSKIVRRFIISNYLDRLKSVNRRRIVYFFYNDKVVMEYHKSDQLMIMDYRYEMLIIQDCKDMFGRDYKISYANVELPNAIREKFKLEFENLNWTN